MVLQPTCSLRDVGFDQDIERRFASLCAQSTPASADWQPARIVFANRELYKVATATGIASARPSGRLRHAEMPAVGDWVAVADDGGGGFVVHGIVERRAVLSRNVAGQRTDEQIVAANVDLVFLVMGLDGDYNLRRLERFAVMTAESGADGVVVLTKADLADDPVAAVLDARGVVPGLSVFAVSALEGQGLDPLRALLAPGRTIALIGSSGVGKSTLVNRLCDAELMRTGAVRSSDDRGRHTTTHRELVVLPGGGVLVDNPGVREIQLWADDDALAASFDDVDYWAKACRFNDCSHQDEPGCAVRAALDAGELSAERLASWRGLEREIRHLERRRDVAARRRDDKALSKLYKRVQRDKQARRRVR